MENSILHAKKLGLPEIILPNDVRNDLYVNIVHGELKKGKFSSIIYFQVIIYISKNYLLGVHPLISCVNILDSVISKLV